MNTRGPLIAAIAILLLPFLYIATYYANVEPGIILAPNSYHYRYGGAWSARLYWPLEIVDRRARPATWDPWQDVGGPGLIMAFETVCTLTVEEEFTCTEGEQCCLPATETAAVDPVNSEPALQFVPVP